MTDNKISNSLGLYLHIPFCKSKCPYCDFYSLDRIKDGEPERTELMERYADALMLHMEDYSTSAQNRDIDTVYFGGGTPTVLPGALMLDILGSVMTNFNVTDDTEITVEMNPATVSLKELKKLVKAGVNRVSIGMQSANDKELKKLGRIHTFEDFKRAFEDARAAGIENINVDVMYGIPDQTEESLKNTLERVFELDPEHISLYGLKIEEGTPFDKQKDTLCLPDEDTEYKMYVDSVQLLSEHGYDQYEISNFSKKGYECRHNIRYWNCEEYIGFGPGAHSYYNGHRFSFKKDLMLYITELESAGMTCENGGIVNEDYEIDMSNRIGEYVMLRMRMNEGVNTDDFAEKFGLDFEKTFGKYLKSYVEAGFMTHKGKNYAFTVAGKYVSNYILSAMIDFDSDIVSGVADGSDS